MILDKSPKDVKVGEMVAMFGESTYKEVGEISDMGIEYWIDFTDRTRRSAIGMVKVDKGPITCHICGEVEEDSYLDTPGERAATHMWEEKLCFECYYWMGYVKEKDHPYSVRVNGRHYTIGPDNTWPRGIGGNIQFFDGTVCRSNNIWCQDEIPERFREMLPDNAEFFKKERK